MQSCSLFRVRNPHSRRSSSSTFNVIMLHYADPAPRVDTRSEYANVHRADWRLGATIDSVTKEQLEEDHSRTHKRF